MRTPNFHDASCHILPVAEIPLGEMPFDGISLDNVGDIVGGIFKDGEKAVGKDYAVTAGKLTVEDWAMQLSTHMKPKHFRDAKVSNILHQSLQLLLF